MSGMDWNGHKLVPVSRLPRVPVTRTWWRCLTCQHETPGLPEPERAGVAHEFGSVAADPPSVCALDEPLPSTLTRRAERP